MLGRLFNSAASSLNPATFASRNSAPLESVTEEEHTRTLLFPDAALLSRSPGNAYPFHGVTSPNASAASAFDDRGGLELEVPKDFRIVIAQDALGDRDEPCILLDTQVPEVPVQGLGLERANMPETPHGSIGHARSRSTTKSATWDLNASGGITSPTGLFSGSISRSPATASNPIGVGAFGRARLRSSTLTGGSLFDADSGSGRTANDTHGLLNCIFGSSAFSYRGPSTKMHVLSLEDEHRAAGQTTSPVLSPDSDIFGPRDPRDPRRRTPLSRAYTMSAQEGYNSLPDPKLHSTGKVLFTRMFSISLPETADTVTPVEEHPAGNRTGSFSTGFPFPDVSRRPKMKEKRAPMYAVAIVVKLPLIPKTVSRPPSRLGSRAPSIARPQGSVSSSLDSEGRSTWSFVDHNPTLLPTTASLDDRVDVLVEHWDVITRTLSFLEKEASKEILARLIATSMQVPRPLRPMGMHRSGSTIVQLAPNALFDHAKLKEDATHAMRRISLALRIPRVVPGQGRWGVWREEARWIAKCLGDKEHSFFFLVLLTSFLGNHTEWLSLLGPDWYRRRHHLQQKAQQDMGLVISHRTVIVSPDKMVARRLIFLLSAFLPGKPRIEGISSPLRPGTSASASFRPSSHSPPNAVPLRQESLLRIMNKRARANRVNTYEPKQEGPESTSSADGPNSDKADTPELSHHRADSDARSIKTASLPIPFNDPSTRKSSAATTSTATPSKTTPVPYFTSKARPTAGAEDAYQGLANDSNESLASTNLIQTLKRSEGTNVSMESSGSHAGTGSRWGSLMSGFWSPRQDSSTDGSDLHFTPKGSSRNNTLHGGREAPKAPAKLDTLFDNPQKPMQESNERSSRDIPIRASQESELAQDQSVSDTVVEEPLRSPLKLFVDEADGVIDVDLPLPGFLSLSSSVNDSATMLTSPKKPRTSVSSLEGSHLHTPLPSKDNENLPVQVSGWLKRFHEDFSIQAVKPYEALEADIKRAMAAEPTPQNIGSTPQTASESGPADRWVDVCTTLIADTRSSTIKRVRLQRRIRPASDSNPTTESPAVTPHLAPSGYPQLGSLLGRGNLTRKASSATLSEAIVAESPNVEERFIEEAVMDLDSVLTDAVERVLARSTYSSKHPSRAASPTRGATSPRTSRHRDSIDARNANPLSQPTTTTPPAQEETQPSLEIPRQECKKMVLGALEEVVRSVQTERSQEDTALGRDILGSAAAAAAEGGATEKGKWWRGKRELDALRQAMPDNGLREGVKKWLAEVEESF